ncbi:hypothetical protein CON95_11560 [Bacillus toyonensis]|nr:hypothetical protein CON95_11560 [Bacillus toyonensis]
MLVLKDNLKTPHIFWSHFILQLQLHYISVKLRKANTQNKEVDELKIVVFGKPIVFNVQSNKYDK